MNASPITVAASPYRKEDLIYQVVTVARDGDAAGKHLDLLRSLTSLLPQLKGKTSRILVISHVFRHRICDSARARAPRMISRPGTIPTVEKIASINTGTITGDNRNCTARAPWMIDHCRYRQTCTASRILIQATISLVFSG